MQTVVEQVEIRYVPTEIAVLKEVADDKVLDVGGETSFIFLVENRSDWPMTLTSFVDDKLGDLNGQGNCTLSTLPARGQLPSTFFNCSIDAVVPAGTTDHTNTVTVHATPAQDPLFPWIEPFEPGPAQQRTATASATVGRITTGLAATKVPSPASVPEAGGDVTFTFGVTNTSGIAVVIDSLVDSVFGSLAGQGTCSVGQTVEPAQSYTCTVVKRLSGTAATPHQNTFTVTATTVEQEQDKLVPADAGFTVESAQATAALTATASASVTFTAAGALSSIPSVPTESAPPAPTNTPAVAAAPVALVPAQTETAALAHTGRDYSVSLAGGLLLLGLGTTALGVVRRRREPS